MPKVLKEYRIKLESVLSGEIVYPEKVNLGIKSKLGGEPDWAQVDETPECPACGEQMSFVGQIDSIEHNEDHNPHKKFYGKQDYMFGDVGLIYVFFCFECLKTQSVFQCG
jgi:uncharacterized protein YwqG